MPKHFAQIAIISTTTPILWAKRHWKTDNFAFPLFFGMVKTWYEEETNEVDLLGQPGAPPLPPLPIFFFENSFSLVRDRLQIFTSNIKRITPWSHQKTYDFLMISGGIEVSELLSRAITGLYFSFITNMGISVSGGGCGVLSVLKAKVNQTRSGPLATKDEILL